MTRDGTRLILVTRASSRVLLNLLNRRARAGLTADSIEPVFVFLLVEGETAMAILRLERTHPAWTFFLYSVLGTIAGLVLGAIVST